MEDWPFANGLNDFGGEILFILVTFSSSVRSPRDMFSFLTSSFRPLKPEVDTAALEAAMAVAENAGVTK